MSGELSVLAVTAAWIGLVHTLLGPDHFLPFVALGRAGRWSVGRTLAVTLACGAGHVLASLALGLLGAWLGWSLLAIETFDGLRSQLVGWGLLAFGLTYAAWGLRRGLRGRTHSHAHVHADGTVHSHAHDHRGAHAHPHAAGGGARVTPWLLFVLFVLGPCEPLIPLLMASAAAGGWVALAVVAAVFGAVTLVTMTTVVWLAVAGLSKVRLRAVERYGHALAGVAVAACGLAIQLGL